MPENIYATEEEIEAGNPLQRNADWFATRCGCLTGSRVADALAVSAKTGKPLKARTDLIEELVAERLTGNCVEHFQSSAMQWGTACEEAARDAYEAETGIPVDLVGFVHHPTIEWLGASPDGLAGKDGLVEIKCPTSVTHVRRLMNPLLGVEQYRYQMLLQLACTGRKWCDLVDYDPRFKDPLQQILIVRFEPKPGELDEFLSRCKDFLAEVETAVAMTKVGASAAREVREAGNE